MVIIKAYKKRTASGLFVSEFGLNFDIFDALLQLNDFIFPRID